MPLRARNARGFTLAEVMVVMVLAGVVTLGLLGFYLNSQAMWLETSAQALAQRDATTLLESIAARADSAARVEIFACGAADSLIAFYRVGDIEPYYSFWWDKNDHLVHQGPGTCTADRGPVVPTFVEHFSMSIDPSLPLLHLELLQLRSTTGQRVQMQSTFALRNAP